MHVFIQIEKYARSTESVGDLKGKSKIEKIPKLGKFNF
jgi:hypothetical protein